MARVKVACVVVVMCMVVLSASMTHAAITCEQITDDIAPCTDYLKNGGMPPMTCCNSLRSLGSTASTTMDRQITCKCLKTLAENMGGSLNANNAASLPSKCGINIPFDISTSNNCNSFNLF